MGPNHSWQLPYHANLRAEAAEVPIKVNVAARVNLWKRLALFIPFIGHKIYAATLKTRVAALLARGRMSPRVGLVVVKGVRLKSIMMKRFLKLCKVAFVV